MSPSMNKAMQSLRNRIFLLIGRAKLSGVTDEGPRQYVQFSALAGETKDAVERVQEYGFTSHPLPGAQVVFASISGNRDHPVAISVDDPRYRITGLEPGEVAVYTHDGTRIILKNGGEIHMTAATKVRIDTPLLECTGEILDKCDSDGLTMSEMREIYICRVSMRQFPLLRANSITSWLRRLPTSI